MTSLSHKLTGLFISLIGILLLYIHPVFSQQIRKPVYDGSFYPKSPDELTALIEKYSKRADQTLISIPVGAKLKALILPHAGFIYSGLTAAHCSKVLKGRDFKKIIIMGPDHRVSYTNCSVSDVSAYDPPLGKVALPQDSLILRQKYTKLFRTNKKSDNSEHSIEVQIPFLQHYLNDFQIIPIVMGPGDIQKYADAIATVIGKNTLIVVSSDLSHYLSYDQAIKTDQETIGRILDLDYHELLKKNNIAC